MSYSICLANIHIFGLSENKWRISAMDKGWAPSLEGGREGGGVGGEEKEEKEEKE